MNVGKLPPNLLKSLLANVPMEDSRVLLGPCVGEDAAVIEMGAKSLVASTDPITFATDSIGWYAVHVNANDVACMGAQPQWFLATVLLPEGATSELAENIFHQMTSACQELNVTLVGGHSEVTHMLAQPIVVGQMLGEVPRDKVVRTSGAQPGDAVVLTQGIAIEGTAILARDAQNALEAAGVLPDVLRRAMDYLVNPGISVVDAALISSSTFSIHCMHDPTEGGIVTGLREIAQSAKVGLDIYADLIPVLPECKILCEAMKLDPLGLLASGALLITLSDEEAPQLIQTLARVGIYGKTIGHVTSPAEGLRLHTATRTCDLPVFERDELAKHF
ncbi:AIR synthase family protein, partial [Dehalococcoidia bacterium]|nr:AIR synthase family protein [Dehalococcoidia bacterium]